MTDDAQLRTLAVWLWYELMADRERSWQRYWGTRVLMTPMALLLIALMPLVPSPTSPALADECALIGGFKPPFTRSYKVKHGGTLVFVAVSHGHDVSTRTLLGATFARYKPDVVLVEGFSSAESTNPEYLKHVADYAAERNAAGRADEVTTSIRLATSGGTPFSGWDLNTQELYRASLSHGFALENILGAHLIRRGVDPFDGSFEAVLQSELRDAGQGNRENGFNYSRWYQSRYGHAFDQANGTPCGSGVASRIVKFETAQRNQNALRAVSHLAES